MKLPIYMDHHATTPLDPAVISAMEPCFDRFFGNPSSRHPFGWEADKIVRDAREEIAIAIGGRANEVIFTGGATESINLAIQGVSRYYRKKGNHLVTAATEHPAVLDCCRQMEREGFRLTVVRVGKSGIVSPEEVKAAISRKTVLVSIMQANNEIGTLNPVAEIGALCRERGIFFHVDASQSLCKIPVDVAAIYADLLSFTAHKIYGPKGVGALWKSPRVRLQPILYGGGQEQGYRSGTLNVPGIAGLAAAVRIGIEGMEEEAIGLRLLRDRLLAKIQGGLDGVYLNGDMEQRLPGNLNVSFEGIDGDELVLAIRQVAVSSGSACAAHETGPSPVLVAIGVPHDLAEGSIRVGLGRGNTQEEVEFAANLIIEKVRALRATERLRGA